MIHIIQPHKKLSYDTLKQKERFQKLYGPGDYTAIITKNMKHTMWLTVCLIVLLILVMIFQIYNSSQSTQGVNVDSKGNIVSIARPDAGDKMVVLEADIVNDSGNVLSTQSIKLLISPLQTVAEKKSIEANELTGSRDDTTQQEIRKAAYQLNSDTTTHTLTLPSELENGTRIYWVPKKSYDGWILLLVFFIGGYGVYKSRDSNLVKTEIAARESVLRELPEFVNKLVLLLNAGLVISTAFHKIVSDHNRIKGDENNYFYGQLSQIISKCSETNESFQFEIRSFAVRTGVVEFMRLSNIINDSMTKGSDLIYQLKMEGDGLWAARRKQIEEKGKLAETKLTFPLVILLLVLLMITIAPAMMEM
jgi:tight adherence protein C